MSDPIPRKLGQGRFIINGGPDWDDLEESERKVERRRFLDDFLRVKSEEELIGILAHDPAKDFESHCADWHNEEARR